MEAKILVVDDDAAIRRLIDLRLQLADFEVITAAASEEALRLAAEAQPDAVILDVIMPVMDGFEVCRRIRANPGHTQGIVMLAPRAGTEALVAGSCARAAT